MDEKYTKCPSCGKEIIHCKIITETFHCDDRVICVDHCEGISSIEGYELQFRNAYEAFDNWINVCEKYLQKNGDLSKKM